MEGEVDETEELSSIIQIGAITFDEKCIIGRSLATVFKGTLNNEKIVAVKRIEVKNQCIGTSEDHLKELKGSSNIVQLLHIEIDKNFRYYALELCDGSMNQLFLPDHSSAKYRAIMPAPEKVLLQLAEGLEYIHSKKIVHRDIKPHNVLFKVDAINKKVTMKWADFGLSKPFSDYGHFSLSDATGSGTPCWIAPEILEKNSFTAASNNNKNPKISFKCNIWSAGCVFFYYLTKGKHPFGELNSFLTDIPSNARKGNPINMKSFPCELNSTFAAMIEKMVEKDPESRISLKDIINKFLKPLIDSPLFVIPIERKIRIMNRKFRIGCTSYGNIPGLEMHHYDGDFQVEILRGIFGDGDKEVAVKRIPDYRWEVGGEKNLRNLEHHDNVLQFFHTDFHDTADIRYYAFELCAGSLEDLFEKSNRRPTNRGVQLPKSSYKAITSLIQGLNHIHCKGLIHGRIKPKNVLISLTQPVIMKWADFGLVDVTIGMIYKSGTQKWFAPEIMEEMREYDVSTPLSYFTTSNKCDVWSAGAVFYYYLTKGKHPEDLGVKKEEMFPAAIKSSITADDADHFFARDVIAQMIAFDPEARIRLVPDAIDQLESNYNKKFIEQKILRLYPLSEPLESDVDRLCQLFKVEGINLNCSKTVGKETPLSLLCSSLGESKEHGRSLETLLQTMLERQIEPKGLIDTNFYLDDGFNIVHRLCKHYQAENLENIIRLIHSIDDKALWSKDFDGDYYPLHLLCRYYKVREHQEKLFDIIRAFIDCGFDIHTEDRYGNNALHVLCQYQPDNVIEVIEKLLNIGISVNLKAKNQNEENLIHKLCRTDDPGMCLKDGIQFFVDRNFDLNEQDSSGTTILHSLCNTKNGGNKDLLEIVRLLKREEVNVNVLEDDGFTALHLLCINYQWDDMIDILQELINDIDLNAKTEYGSTALHYLCKNCKKRDDLFNIIKFFLDSGRIHLNVIDVNRKTILHHLCENYQNSSLANIVQLLIENGIDINAKDSNGDTAVQHLVIQNYPHTDVMNQIIQLFIDKGCKSAQVCQQDLLKDSEILNHPDYHFVVKRQRLESRNDQIIEEIVKRLNPSNAGASGKSSPTCKPTLTDLCQLYGEELIKECIKSEYNFTATKKCEEGTEVHHLCKFYKKENLFTILKAVIIEGGVHVHIKGQDGNTFLHLVCKYYDGDNIIDIVEMLVNDCGADPNARNDHRRTPLYFLCYCCRRIEDISIADVIRRFIEIGADPKIKDHTNMTTLHALCRSYKGANISEIVELLIEKGVDLNAKTTTGETAPGLLREKYPHKEELFKTVQLFMDKGFDMNAKTVPKWTNSETSNLNILKARKDGASSVCLRFTNSGNLWPDDSCEGT